MNAVLVWSALVFIGGWIVHWFTVSPTVWNTFVAAVFVSLLLVLTVVSVR